MPLRKAGLLMDRNGYNPSIMCTTYGRCYLCKRYGDTARHEIFGASNRDKSKELGLWVNLCPDCHQNAPYAVHKSRSTALELKRDGQAAYCRKYKKSNDEFRMLFGRSYL